MNFPLFIARRYFFARKSSTGITNWIARITMAGILIGTMALVIVLSVFNGLDHLIRSLFNSFDPDIKIVATQGKSFHMSDSTLALVASQEGILGLCPVIEDNALLRYRERETVAAIKGVCDQFPRITGIDSMLTEGRFSLSDGDFTQGVIGQELAFQLGVGLNFITPLHIYVPRRSERIILDPTRAFNHRHLFPSGIFSIQQEYDSKYLIVSFDFAQDLLGFDPNEYSALEILTGSESISKVLKKTSQDLLGPSYRVLDRYDQHAYFYKVMASEKWAVFLILGFILIIASFNTISSLTLLLLEKKQDIRILQGMGSTLSSVRRIFLYEGMLITGSGAILGMILGALLCWVQMKWGIIQFPDGGSYVIDRYPVRLILTDFIWIALLVSVIGFLASWAPLQFVKNRYFSLTTEE